MYQYPRAVLEADFFKTQRETEAESEMDGRGRRKRWRKSEAPLERERGGESLIQSEEVGPTRSRVAPIRASTRDWRGPGVFPGDKSCYEEETGGVHIKSMRSSPFDVGEAWLRVVVV